MFTKNILRFECEFVRYRFRWFVLNMHFFPLKANIRNKIKTYLDIQF